MNTSQRFDKLREAAKKEAEKAIEKLDRQEELYAIIEKAAPDLPPDDWKAYILDRPLYGEEVWLERRTDHYSTTYKGSSPASAEDLRRSLEMLPPVPVVKARTGGCVTFCPESFAVEAEGENPEKFNIECPIMDLRLTGKPADYSRVLDVTWHTKIGRLGVKVTYPLPWDHRWMLSNWRKVVGKGYVRYVMNNPTLPGTVVTLAGVVKPSSVTWAGPDDNPRESVLYWRRGNVKLEQVLGAITEAMNGD